MLVLQFTAVLVLRHAVCVCAAAATAVAAGRTPSQVLGAGGEPFYIQLQLTQAVCPLHDPYLHAHACLAALEQVVGSS